MGRESFEIKDNLLAHYYGYEEHVVIPDGITAIGVEAFSRCEELRSVVIPESVSVINRRAFSKCYNLSSVKFLGEPEWIADSAFSLCPGLVDENRFVILKGILFAYYGEEKNVVIPDGVTTIGRSAFLMSDKVQSVVIPESVRTIGDRAFAECENLESVRFPKGLTNIGRDAFAGCAKLANADGCVIVNDIPLQVAPQPSCLAETQAATKEKIHPGKDLYTDILHGLQEMADDAWVEDTVLAWADKYLEDPASISESEKTKIDQAIWDGIVCLWDRMTATVTSQKRVPFKKMQFILRETYKTLTFFHREDRVPKGVANILLYMDNFLYQVAASEGPVEGCIFGILFDHYALIHDMITALKEGFLAGDYKTAYPVITVRDCRQKIYLFDMLNDSLKDLVKDK